MSSARGRTKQAEATIVSKLDEVNADLNANFVEVNSKLEKVSAKLDGVNSKLDGVGTKLDGVAGKLDTMSGKFDRLIELGEMTVKLLGNGHRPPRRD